MLDTCGKRTVMIVVYAPHGTFADVGAVQGSALRAVEAASHHACRARTTRVSASSPKI
jgi:hypothetical protein